MNPIVIIPARMASTRLPGKPLADINGLPMIVHVMKRAMDSGIGPVFIACAEEEIAKTVEKAGGHAILTDPSHISGTDRINEALSHIDPKKEHDIIVNVQGDLPTIEPEIIRSALLPFKNKKVDITTLVAELQDDDEANNPNVVKAIVKWESDITGRAVSFTRNKVSGKSYHHIGLYAYRRMALEKFTSLPPSPKEKQERLEQLRALENNMRIDAVLVDTIPFGVDTPADLEKARKMLK